MKIIKFLFINYLKIIDNLISFISFILNIELPTLHRIIKKIKNKGE